VGQLALDAQRADQNTVDPSTGERPALARLTRREHMKTHWKQLAFLTACLAIVALFAASGLARAQGPDPIEKLGEFLYKDEDLSSPDGMSCATCHDLRPEFAFTDPDTDLPVSAGILPHRFGGRNAPSAGYAMYAPLFHFDTVEGLWIGGQFWDGRATGDVLDDPLADQAVGPPLNPVEMANQTKDQVVNEIRQSAYAGLFEEVWGPGSLDDVEAAYDNMGRAIAAFERTPLFAPFDSKYDAYLQACLDRHGKPDDCAIGKGPKAKKAGEEIFTPQEWDGLLLFMNDVNDNDGILEKGEGAMCVACHVADWIDPAALDNPVVVPAWSPDGMVPPVFTDFTFDNLGVPKSTEYPIADQPIDLGLGAIVGDEDENGKFKVMSLRNIGITVPYAHNGLFKNLKEITHFYNTRDDPAAGWAEPEYLDTVNFDELGNLGLSDADEDALVAFMNTLSDGYTP
jgi:cytochrome c peroxidase